MKHCSNCKSCVTDIRVLNMCGVWVKKCKIFGHCIIRPFFSGLGCKEWKRR